MKTLLLQCVLLLSCGIASAADVRTYRIVQSDELAFHYGGGLLDFNLSARLKGAFDITVGDDNSAAITRFEVTLHNLVNTGTYDLGWTEGDALAERLLQQPNELWGALFEEGGLDTIEFSQTEAAFDDITLLTMARIAHSGATTAEFRLSSQYVIIDLGLDGIPIPLLDAPSITIGSVETPLFIELVPEPTAAALIGMGLAFSCLSTRKF
jgi:hypothetical protein